MEILKTKEMLFIGLLIVMTPIMTVTPTMYVLATIGSDEFCDDNPGHFACDGKIGNKDEDENDNDNERDCENPPSAASCNNGVDTNGVQSDNSEPSGECYNIGYDDGRNGNFEMDAYQDNCGSTNNPSDNEYYNGFIDGCMSVEGNTRSVCESATDA